MAGKDRRLGLAVEHLPVECFAGERHADDGVDGFASAPHGGLAGRPHGGERDDVHLRAGKFGAGNGARGQLPQDRLQPVMAEVVQMVGLGRRDQDLVDLRPEQVGQRIAAPDPERREHLVERMLQVAQGRRARN